MTVVSQADDGIRIRQVMNTVYPGPADDVIIRNTGTITAFADGIDASVRGSMTVENSGNGITTTRFSAIKARAEDDLTITNSATLSAGQFGSGIDAEADEGQVTVTNQAAITAGEFGIRAHAGSAATITNNANIMATTWAGIESSGQAVTVDNTGDVSSLGDAGIEVTGFGASSADVTRVTTGAAGQSGQINAKWQASTLRTSCPGR